MIPRLQACRDWKKKMSGSELCSSFNDCTPPVSLFIQLSLVIIRYNDRTLHVVTFNPDIQSE